MFCDRRAKCCLTRTLLENVEAEQKAMWKFSLNWHSGCEWDIMRSLSLLGNEYGDCEGDKLIARSFQRTEATYISEKNL